VAAAGEGKALGFGEGGFAAGDTFVDKVDLAGAQVITNGTPGERKRAIEALVHEVRVEDDHLIPVFKIPQPGATPDNDEPAATITATGWRNSAAGGGTDRLLAPQAGC
jgi:hypothetical protein